MEINEVAKLLASDGAAGDWFGYSVAISGNGNLAVIGAYGDDDGGSTSGSAYIFTKEDEVWVQQAKLLATDSKAAASFGYNVAINYTGDTVIIGARGTFSVTGAAYVFVRSGTIWTEQAKLSVPDISGSYFGCSVSISDDGNTVIVGANLEEVANDTYIGAAYIFVRSAEVWSRQAKLLASDKAAVGYFGRSVSISGDGSTAIIGAFGHTEGRKSSVYIFVRSGAIWSQQAKFVSDDISTNWFGYSVDLNNDGSTAAVGSYWEHDLALYSGSTYIFVKDGSSWSKQSKLLANDGSANDNFGSGVSLSGDGNTAVIGSYRSDGNTSDSGSAYIFTRVGNSWNQRTKLLATDGETGDRFGHSVSLSSDGSIAIVGAYSDVDDTGINSGSVYFFSANGTGGLIRLLRIEGFIGGG